jgi:stage IV sporulation protein FB
LSCRLFGFSVTIQGSFLLIVGVLGYVSFPEELDRVVAFVLIALVAIVVHELGHAFAARSQGTIGTPSISLEGMAGLTRYRLQREPSRGQSMMISFAGPFAGIVLGVIILVVAQSGVVDRTPLIDDLFLIGLFTTFGWSAFNLLPIVPLDGGHIMTDLIPGSVPVRRRRAALVSVVVASLAAVWMWVALRSFFGPAILGMMAFQNFKMFSNSKPASALRPPLSPRDDSPLN